MSNNLPNNKTSPLKQTIYTTQQNPEEPAKRPRNVRQDKGVLTSARAVAGQPAPLTKGSRAEHMNTTTPRAQKTNPARVKLVHTTLHLHPLVRRVLEQKAAEAGVSISAIGAEALYEWALSDIKRQQATTLKTELRQIIREELQAFGHRIVFFLMRIAFASEQARILITNALKFVLKLAGLEQKSYYTLLDESAKMAKRNIIRNTPQIKSLLEEWEASFIASKDREEEAKN
jgi:hypothetical protein